VRAAGHAALALRDTCTQIDIPQAAADIVGPFYDGLRRVRLAKRLTEAAADTG
jgi:hypothetical protein